MSEPHFTIGQIVHHRRFDYRGVIIDIDLAFAHTVDWYDLMAKSEPDKDQPWYRVLVHLSDHETYVAQSNLEPDLSGEPIVHPRIDEAFDEWVDGYYARTRNLS